MGPHPVGVLRWGLNPNTRQGLGIKMAMSLSPLLAPAGGLGSAHCRALSPGGTHL